MPIFSRRVLQKMLDAAGEVAPMREQAARLNEATERSLSAEWEVAILFALATCGNVVHEPTLGRKRPDVLFRNDTAEFVADVVTVNDDGYETANPYRAFEQEFWRRLRKSGVPPNRFSYKIAVDIQRKSEQFDVTFWYSPIGSGTGQSGLYRESSSLTKNPIYNALKRKRDQLKLSLYPGLKGIILCDGDCHQLRHPDRIVRKFLQTTKTVNFVAVCTLRGDRFSRRTDGIRVELRVFVNASCTSDEESAAIGEILSRAVQALPPANDDVTNACNHLRWKTRHVGLGYHGGYEWGGDYVRISSRVYMSSSPEL